jgi:hypothetical protein
VVAGPFRNIEYAMRALEAALGEETGILGYTGHADVEDLEEGIWPMRPDAGPEPAQ